MTPTEDKRLPANCLDGRCAAQQTRATLATLRRSLAPAVLVYYWACAAAVVACAVALSVPVQPAGLPLALAGTIATGAVLLDPASRATRMMLAVAINMTWMVGLYVIWDVHDGAYMLEMHMMYFVNSVIVMAFACWRTVVMTLVSALLHHLVLTLVAPQLVWPVGQLAWQHFANHALLGALSCTAGVAIARMIRSSLHRQSEIIAAAQWRATHDGLTGLRNRAGLDEAMGQMSDDTVMVLADLDGFTQINDSAGRDTGDALLVAVARRLRQLAPPGAAIARLDGDEFAVVLPAAASERAHALARTLLDWTDRPQTVAGRTLRFGVSIGIAARLKARRPRAGSPGCGNGSDVRRDGGGPWDASTRGTACGDGRLAARLIEEAGIALNAAKAAGRGRVVTFDAALRDRAIANKRLADDILRGLDAGEFRPCFQLQHDGATGAIIGAEALARWHHPERGILTPDVFLPVMADIGRLQDLDHLILEGAVDTICRLEAQGLSLPKISVNVSFARLADPALLQAVAALPAMRATLAFEIVESVLFDTLDPADVWAVDRLREMGVAVELDDFGTGHASLVGLTVLRPDLLKIDRALLCGLGSDPVAVDILRAIGDMAQRLGIDTLVEGVETDEQLATLRGLGFQRFQGYLFGRPMPAAELATTVQAMAAGTPAALPIS